MPTYLVEEGLDVCLEGGAGLHDELLGEHEGVLALRLLRLDDVDEDDVEQLVGDEVGLRDQRREHVQHERFHLPGVLVAARIRTFIFKYKDISISIVLGYNQGHNGCESLTLNGTSKPCIGPAEYISVSIKIYEFGQKEDCCPHRNSE